MFGFRMLFAACLLIAPANFGIAQNLAGSDRSLQARSNPLRIQVQISIQAASTGDPSQQEGARRSLYEMANRECKLLTDVFGGECRLVQMNTTSQIQQRSGQYGGQADLLNANASTTYEIVRP